jgi:hypothetical protein
MNTPYIPDAHPLVDYLKGQLPTTCPKNHRKAFSDFSMRGISAAPYSRVPSSKRRLHVFYKVLQVIKEIILPSFLRIRVQKLGYSEAHYKGAIIVPMHSLGLTRIL